MDKARRTITMALAAALLIPAGASAASLVSAVPGAPDPGGTGDFTLDFESALPAGIVFAAGSQYHIYKGLVPHAGYAPAGDNTFYLSVPGGGVAGSATIDFTGYTGRRLGDFSLYWGSIDRANSLTIATTTGALNVLGSQLISRAYGSATSATANRRVSFALAPAERLLGLTFASPTSFEVDDIVFKRDAPPAAVPEPATWAMLVLGMGCVGGAMRLRSGRRQQPT